MKTLAWLSLTPLLAAGAKPTYAHDFYDQWCCNSVDCAPIPTEAVRITDRGYLVTLRPTDHVMLLNEKEPRTYLVAFREARVSPDGKYHACIYPTPETMRCFYAPPMGF